MKKDEIYKGTNVGLLGVPKDGNKPLDFIVAWKVEINKNEPTGYDNEGVETFAPSGLSRIFFRFHSGYQWAEKTIEECAKANGAIHARAFVYNRIDKTEEELFTWAMADDTLSANDGKKLKTKSAIKAIKPVPPENDEGEQ